MSSGCDPIGSASGAVKVKRWGCPPKLMSVWGTATAMSGGCETSRMTSSLGFSTKGWLVPLPG